MDQHHAHCHFVIKEPVNYCEAGDLKAMLMLHAVLLRNTVILYLFNNNLYIAYYFLLWEYVKELCRGILICHVVEVPFITLFQLLMPVRFNENGPLDY
jgi:hypothetical protein